MNISTIIEETAKALYKYGHTFNPEQEIIGFLKKRGELLLSRDIENQVKKIYRENIGFFSSREYLYLSEIRKLLSILDEKNCIDFCWNFSKKIDDPGLFNISSHYYDNALPPIRLNTRKKIVNLLPEDFTGRDNLDAFLRPIFTIPEITEENKPQTREKIFEFIGAYDCSTLTFRKFLLKVVNSNYRDESENRILVSKINDVIEKDGFILEIDQEKSQYHPVYHFKNQEYKAKKAPQHLIFASIGTKPNIGISDALDGKVSVISEDGDPLTYDRKILDHLTWAELEDWWEENNLNPNLTLKKRLIESLDSEAERMFFKGYFSLFHSKFQENLPALIPQIYLAYDPMRAKDLPEGKTRIRQRVDFLMILPNLKRVIIEIDGKHHYAHEDGRADPHRYAEMVRVDRELRLRGYEVFRFGGAEFYNKNSSQTPEENAIELVRTFFTALFEQYEIGSVVG